MRLHKHIWEEISVEIRKHNERVRIQYAYNKQEVAYWDTVFFKFFTTMIELVGKSHIPLVFLTSAVWGSLSKKNDHMEL